MMNVGGEGLGEKIGPIRVTRFPGDGELALSNAIADPVETHVDALGPLDLQCVVAEADGAFVVTLDRGCGLRMAEGVQAYAEPDRVLRVDEDAAVFRLGCRRNDDVEDATGCEEGRVVGAEKGVAANDGPRARAREV